MSDPHVRLGGAQLSSKKRIYPREEELRVRVRGDSDSDSDSRHHRPHRKQSKKGGCCRNVDPQTSILFLMAFMLTILAVLVIVIVVSVYGPAGKVQNTITTVSDMVAKVNRSGLADVIVTVVNNWQVGNHTQQTFTLLNALYESGGQVTDIVMAIEPEMVHELANRTSITVGGLLTLAETIINNRGIDIVRLALACFVFLTRVLLRRSRCTASPCHGDQLYVFA